ncbi:hypothetical protein HD554DRAFT_1676319 [Boletus coccyginus]|nr:hypothetical protein HD554DRAFT_1676319 [Boletus coccyginus]
MSFSAHDHLTIVPPLGASGDLAGHAHLFSPWQISSLLDHHAQVQHDYLVERCHSDRTPCTIQTKSKFKPTTIRQRHSLVSHRRAARWPPCFSRTCNGHWTKARCTYCDSQCSHSMISCLSLSTRMSSNPTASSEPLLELTYSNHLLKLLDIWLDPTDLIRNILKCFMLGYIEANCREMDTSIWTSHREMFKHDSERAKHD